MISGLKQWVRNDIADLKRLFGTFAHVGYGNRPNNPISSDVSAIMAAECNAIDRTMRELGVFAWCDDKAAYASSTAGIVRYRIQTGTGVKASKVTEIKKDIGIAVNAVRSDMLNTDRVDVAIDDLLRVTLPYPGARTVLRWGSVTPSKRPMTTFLGRRYGGRKATNAEITLGDGEAIHMFVGGGTGSGKTVLLCGAITSMCAATSPENLQVVILDTKRCKKLAKLRRLPHVAIYNDPDECAAVLQSVIAELQRRQNGADDSQRIVVVMEEISYMIDLSGVNLETMMSMLARTGRSAGIHLIGCTQYQNSSLLSREFILNFDVRLCGFFPERQAYRQMLGIEDFKEIQLPKGGGAFYLSTGEGSAVRIQSAFLAGDDLSSAIDEVRDRWSNKIPYRMVIDETAMVGELVDDSGMTDAQMVAKILKAYAVSDIFDETGKVIRGKRADLLELLFGDRTDANRNKRTLDRLLEILQ